MGSTEGDQAVNVCCCQRSGSGEETELFPANAQYHLPALTGSPQTYTVNTHAFSTHMKMKVLFIELEKNDEVVVVFIDPAQYTVPSRKRVGNLLQEISWLWKELLIQVTYQNDPLSLLNNLIPVTWLCMIVTWHYSASNGGPLKNKLGILFLQDCELRAQTWYA